MTLLHAPHNTSIDGDAPARKWTLPADLPAERVVAVCDTREQLPLDLSPLQCVRETLATGDYSVQGLTHHIAIERKGLGDLLACCGTERERFDREVMRLMAYPVRALVCETTWSEIEAGAYRSQIKPTSVIGSLLGWMAMGLPVLMARDHQTAGKYVGRLLFIAARRRWRELRALAGSMEATS